MEQVAGATLQALAQAAFEAGRAREAAISAKARATDRATMTAAAQPSDARPYWSITWPPTTAPRPMPMLAPEMLSEAAKAGAWGRLHQPHMADDEERRLGDAPDRQGHGQQAMRLHHRAHECQARRHQRRKQRGGAQRAAVDHAAAQRVADRANGAECHHGPADDLAVETGQPLQHVRRRCRR